MMPPDILPPAGVHSYPSFYQGPGLDHAMVATTWGKLLVELPAQLRGELLYQVFFRHHPVRGAWLLEHMPGMR
jgi:hypothetical protein